METYLELVEERGQEPVKGDGALWLCAYGSFLVDELHEERSECCVVQLQHHCDYRLDERVFELLNLLVVVLGVLLRADRGAQVEAREDELEQRGAGLDQLSLGLAVNGRPEQLEMLERCIETLGDGMCPCGLNGSEHLLRAKVLGHTLIERTAALVASFLQIRRS